MNKSLDVYLQTELVGELSQNSDLQMTFAYSTNATRAISIAMPLQTQTYGAAQCEAFFGGLLPEGDAARKVLAMRFGTSASNAFSLLRSIGAECAGALTIVPHGEKNAVDQAENVVLFTTSELAQHIRELPQRPLFIGINGIRLSLSGVQDKASVSVIDGAIGIPTSGPTTHILKPDLKIAPGAIYCEHLCMKLASRIKIEAASVKLAQAEDQVYLLVQRFDRIKTQDKLARIHQEDFCQALSIVSSHKYQDDGGPKLIDCFALLQQTAFPAKDRLKLLQAVMFNFLVGNMDAHGKNFSLLHSKNGIRFAPLYDILCTTAFPQYSKTMAMDIGDYFEPENINAHEWRTLCADIKYSFPAFKKQAKHFCETIPGAARLEYAEMQAAGWSHPACDQALQIIQANCKEMQERLSL